ncbi:MAG TPA: hypothetical protein VFM03_07405 [Candidatus Limnocylindria bacterium]|jgi:hypothetical protein|nr:hypothetical protein [Candidatus Limnocylindria bacterium]
METIPGIDLFEIEHWIDREEDSQTGLGEPHRFHRIELVARRTTP